MSIKNLSKSLTTSAIAFAITFSLGLPLKADLLELSNIPIFMSTPSKPNVLMVLDNSNSMDEKADGSIGIDDPATPAYDGGSADPESKSEIARNVMKTLVNNYQDKLNLGLMAYKQYQTGADAVRLSDLHNAFVDVSYNGADFNAGWAGALESQTKKYQSPNPEDPVNSIYYNVPAPFYAASNFGTSFCYSPTAQALHTIEDAASGPWDLYRCFGSKTGNSNDLPQWRNSAQESAAGYSDYKYQFQLYPTDGDIAKGIYDFGRFFHWDYVGKSWHSNSSPGRGYLHVPLAPVDTTQKGKLDTKLGISQFVDNEPVNINFPIQNAGLTPLEGTLLSARDYFIKSPRPDEGFDAATCAAIPESCGKDYVILVTDGLPSVAADGSRNNELSRVENAASNLRSAGVKTYVIGFALPFGTDPAQLDSIADKGGSHVAYHANSSESLDAAMRAILSDIIEGEASATPLALTNHNLVEDTKAYLSTFNTADWTGNIKAYGFTDNALNSQPDWSIQNPATGVEPIPSHDSRNIVTYQRDKAGPVGGFLPSIPIDFSWSNLSERQQRQLLGEDWDNLSVSERDAKGVDIVNYLRGDDSNQEFRFRNGKLGDIIHSEPVFVQTPGFHYPDELESGEAYSSFKHDHSDRKAMLYVGANDGMLHAFDAETGVEQFAYIPGMLFNRLGRLASPGYAHEYYVDGNPIVVDAYYNDKWHTILSGGLRAGGQGIYAMDVTNPETMTSADQVKSKLLWEFSDSDDNDMGYSFSEPNIVRMQTGSWAAIFGNGYNNSEDDNFDAGDGRVSTTGHAVLYVRAIESNKTLLGQTASAGNPSFIKISTGVGEPDTPNGFASVAPVDVNDDSVVDYVYAGDLRGNMWRFDFTKCTADNCTDIDTIEKWKTQTPVLIFQATDPDTGAPQPITVRPEVGRHISEGGQMVYFGTGKYLETDDNTQTNQQTQTLYGIWDDMSNQTALTRNKLQGRKMVNVDYAGRRFRVVSEATDSTLSDPQSVGYTLEKDDDLIKWGKDYGESNRGGYGWYIDLKAESYANEGERVINRARLKDGRIIFTSILPTSDACQSGGSGYIIEVDAMEGGRTAHTIYDINEDTKFDKNDEVEVTINGEDTTAPVSGIKLDVGMPAPPSIIGVDGSDAVLVTGSSTVTANSGNGATDVQQLGRESSEPLGRQSWRQCY